MSLCRGTGLRVSHGKHNLYNYACNVFGAFIYADPADVLDVVEEVAPLAAVWDKLALKLHLTFDSIEIINKDNPRDSRACLTKAMAEWTKKNYDTEKFGVPSWRMLIIAVQSFNMGLAQKIAAKHNGTYDCIMYYRCTTLGVWFYLSKYKL